MKSRIETVSLILGILVSSILIYQFFFGGNVNADPIKKENQTDVKNADNVVIVNKNSNSNEEKTTKIINNNQVSNEKECNISQGDKSYANCGDVNVNGDFNLNLD